MPPWKDLAGPVIADTVYSDGMLCAKEATVQFPSITPLTSDYPVMGTLTLPTLGLLESMELSISSQGIDSVSGQLARLRKQQIEIRWVQQHVDAESDLHKAGCKAFFTAVPKGIPGLSIEPGSASDNEYTFEVLRYQLFINGEELWLIDRTSGILRISGSDYAADIQSLL